MFGKLASLLFSVVIPGIAFAMIGKIGLENGLLAIAASLGIGIADVCWTLVPAVPWRRKLVPVILLGVGLAMAGIGAVKLYIEHKRAQPALQTAAQPQPPKLFSLFMEDLKPTNGIRWDAFSDFTIIIAGQDVIMRVFYRVISDFNSHSAYMAFYIPCATTRSGEQTDISYRVATQLVTDHQRLLDDIRLKHWAKAKALGDSLALSTRDFKFSGRIFIYHCDDFSIEQLATLTREFQSTGVDPQFRGMDYALAVWDSIQLGRVKAPPVYEMRNGLPHLVSPY